MKRNNISKYCKLATVLLIDVIPIFFTVTMTATDIESSGFNYLVLMIILLFFFVFNLWALLIYKLTKKIKEPVRREVSFYVLLFLYGPGIVLLLSLLFWG